jgi:hypothetical protein
VQNLRVSFQICGTRTFFLLNKDITPFAFYANFNHYHFFSGLSQGNNHKYVLFYGIPPENNKTQQSKQETDPKMN